MDLDELLAASAPPVSTRTPRLERELDQLVAAAEAARPRRWPLRAALVGGAMAGVLGLGAVASATGILPGWPSFSTSSGQTCQIEIQVAELQPGEGEAISSTFSAAEREQALAEARAYLAAYDYDAVDRDEAIAEWRAAEREIRAAQLDPDERQERLTRDDLEVIAMHRWVITDLADHLAARGLDIRATSVAVSNSGCDL